MIGPEGRRQRDVQKSRTISASLISCAVPKASTSSPSGPASSWRVHSGAIRIASSGRSSTTSSSTRIRPEPDSTT